MKTLALTLPHKIPWSPWMLCFGLWWS